MTTLKDHAETLEGIAKVAEGWNLTESVTKLRSIAADLRARDEADTARLEGVKRAGEKLIASCLTTVDGSIYDLARQLERELNGKE